GSRVFHYSVVFFFFSSRRRHTRWPRDWSSDVCSSDLIVPHQQQPGLATGRELGTAPVQELRGDRTDGPAVYEAQPHLLLRAAGEIGRASCRAAGRYTGRASRVGDLTQEKPAVSEERQV